jgi:hypothetical protein
VKKKLVKPKTTRRAKTSKKRSKHR